MKAIALGGALALALTGCASAGPIDWNGFYAGLYAGTSPAGNDPVYQAGALAGYRFSMAESVILGIEGQVGLGNEAGYSSTKEAFLLADAGVVLGGNVLIFGEVGVGRSLQHEDIGFGVFDSSHDFTLGGLGVEYAANENVHLRADFSKEWLHPSPPIDIFAARANASVLFYFH